MEDNNAVNLPIYECSVCGYKYDPSVGDPQQVIAPETPFDELPPDWVCPVCGASKDLFNKLESESTPLRSESEIKPQKTVKEYRGKDIIVYWYPQDCSHSGKCWGGLPEVFDMDKRPWINISGASTEDIIRTIDKCPSRALQYSLPEDSSIDPTFAKGPGAKDRKIDPDAAAGKIRVIRNGPLLVEGPNRLFDSGGNLIREADRFVLCRCGKTNNPPFCDGSHIPGH